MLSNNGLCLCATAQYMLLFLVMVTIFSNGSIIPTSFKFMELHTLTLAARSYALKNIMKQSKWSGSTGTST